MATRVVFNDGSEGLVPSYSLDYLIREKKITAFKRSDGWVRIGEDPIRSGQKPIDHPGIRWNDFLYRRS